MSPYYRFTLSEAHNGLTSIFPIHGSILRELGFSSAWRRSLLFSLLFLSRFFDSASVIEFAISGFSAKVCARCAAVICPLYWWWAELSFASNTSSAVAVPRFDANILRPFNSLWVCRFVSFGLFSKWDWWRN